MQKEAGIIISTFEPIPFKISYVSGDQKEKQGSCQEKGLT
jgi:hypothetical protein